MVAIATPAPRHLAPRPAPARPTTDAGRRRGLEVAVPSAGRSAGLEWSSPALRSPALRSLACGVVAFVAALCLALLVLTPTGSAAVPDTHVVGAGETLWSIAVDVAPAGEAAVYVDRLVAANGGAGEVVAGDVLVLPAP